MLLARLIRRRWVRVSLIAVFATGTFGSLDGCVYNYHRGGGGFHRW